MMDKRDTYFDLLLEMEGRGDNRLGGLLQYRSEIFDAAIISRILRQFEVLLEGIADNPERLLLDLPLLPPDEANLVKIAPQAEGGYQTDHFVFETN